MSRTLKIPDDLEHLAEKRAAERGNQSIEEYVSELIQEDASLLLSPELEKAALEGLDSGECLEITAEFWTKLKSRKYKNK